MKFVMDIGSSKLRLLALSRINKKSYIFAKEDILYDGFMDGEFLTDDLDEVVSNLFSNMQSKILKPITDVTIGVPNEFSICVCKRISRKFTDLHKLTNEDLFELYSSNANFGKSEEYSVINYSPMQFVLDDGAKITSPIGKKTKSLTVDVSYILAKKSFINKFQDCLTRLGVTNIDFISSSLGQGVLCSEINQKSQFALVDVGHITTSVSIFKGEGLALLSSFSMGGGHISSDIMQVLGMNYKDAELIKRKVILTIEPENSDYYEVCSKGSLVKAPITITNQIVKSRIESIAKIVAEILTFDQVFKDMEIYLTGDGITCFKGAKKILQDATGMVVNEFKNPFDNSTEKYQTSKLGLVSLIDKAI